MIMPDKKSRTPLYEQIYSQIRQDIQSGVISEGSMLRPIRALASEINVSKNTVELAYKQLISEGYISSRRGSGYFVEKINKYAAGEFCPIKKEIEVKENKSVLPIYDFSAESVSSEEFEWKKWKKCIDEALYEEEYNFNGYKDCRGDISLRSSICRYISDTRGVKCDVCQIVICSGTLYAIEDAIGTVKKYTNSKGGNISCDINTEKNIINIFENEGYNPIKFDKSRAYKMLYVSPSHRYPLGTIMSMCERMNYINYASKSNAFIIENDCDSEFVGSNERLPSIQAVDTDDNVIYISSVSRILSPNIRLAYMVLPKCMLDTYMEIHEGYRTAVPVLHQRMLAKYIDMGYMYKHIRQLIKANDDKRFVVAECLKRLESEGYIHICGAIQGAYIAIKCDENKAVTLKEYALKKKIGLHYENGYYMIGFLSINEKDINDAANMLYEVVRKYKECS